MSGLIPTRAPAIRPSAPPRTIDRRRELASYERADEVIAGDLDLRGLKVRGPCRLFNIKVEGSLFLDEARLAEGLDVRRLEVMGRLILDAVHIQGLARFSGCAIHGDARLTGATLGSELFLEGLEVGGGLDLAELELTGGLELQRARVSGPVILDRARIGGWLDASGLEAGALGARAARLGSGFELRDARITGAVDFEDLRVAGACSLRGAALPGGLDMRRAVFSERLDGVRLEAGAARADGAAFARAVNLTEATLAAFSAREAAFEEGLELTRARLSGPADFEDAAITRLALAGARFGDTARLSRGRFYAINAQGARFDADLRGDELACADRADWRGVRVEGDAVFEGAAISSLDLRGALFERRLDLGLRVLPAVIDLEDARAAYPKLTLALALPCLPPGREGPSCEVLCDWLEIQNRYDEVDEARYALRAFRRRERRGLFGALWNLLEWLLVALSCGYGLKPWRVPWALAAVALAAAELYRRFPEAFIDRREVGFFEALRFSVGRLSSARVGELAPKAGSWIEAVALGEGLLGVFLVALFVGTLTRKLAR